MHRPRPSSRKRLLQAIRIPGVVSSLLLLLVILAGCGGSGGGSTTPAGTTVVAAPPSSASHPSSTAVGTAPPTSAADSGPTSQATTTAPPDLSLVVVGDSMPYDSPDDCPGCPGFVNLYAAAIARRLGRAVDVDNLPEHNGLQTKQLLQEVRSDQERRSALAAADIVVVSIGFNDVPWNVDDDPCDGVTTDSPDWSRFDATCAAASVKPTRARLERIYGAIVKLRAGKPTIFRTIDRYNDIIGASGVPPRATAASHAVVDVYSAAICAAARAHGFGCADIYRAFNGRDGLRPAGTLLAGDSTHPSTAGNELIAKVLEGLGYAPLER